MGYYEGHDKCTGVCKKGLFYYSLDLSEGIPTQSCGNAISEDIKLSMGYLAVMSFVSGGLMFVIWVL